MTTRYVNVNNTSPSSPYTSLATAATNIQDAVSVCVTGDIIKVSIGTYLITSPILITIDITIESEDLVPETTIIDGQGVCRCFSLYTNTWLKGLTITNGRSVTDNEGGGINNGKAWNCIISSNVAIKDTGSGTAGRGGGAYGSTLYSCQLLTNTASGANYNGGEGGGAYSCILYNCLIKDNTAGGYGTAYGSGGYGGGTNACTIYSCTLSGNTAADTGYFNGEGGGAKTCILWNCISWDNNHIDNGNTCHYSFGLGADYSGGDNCISTGDPTFVSATNFRLQTSSPCINVGIYQSWMVSDNYGKYDLDGNPRIWDGTVDMGAYEYNEDAFPIITSSAGTGGSITPLGSTAVYYDSDLTLDAVYSYPPYVVDKWYVDSILVQTGGDSYAFTNITQNHTVHVTFDDIINSSSSLSSLGESSSSSTSETSSSSTSETSTSETSTSEVSTSSSTFLEATMIVSQEPKLKKVETILVNSNSPIVKTDGSDNKGTKGSINSFSFSFGALSPGETSKTLIMYLKVPYSLKIQNVKIALIDSGGLDLSLAKFGVESLAYIDYNKIPSQYFEGINITNSFSDAYNVNIGTKSNIVSEYVYLNITLPRNYRVKGGTIKYRWYFDYA